MNCYTTIPQDRRFLVGEGDHLTREEINASHSDKDIKFLPSLLVCWKDSSTYHGVKEGECIISMR